MIFAIVCQDIRDQDMRRMTVAKLWTAFVGYVLGERIFSRLEIILARTCAEFAAVIEDDPLRRSPASLSKPEFGALTSTRHNSLIRSMLASVV